MIDNMTPSVSADRVVFTGRKLAGKDHIAEDNGYNIYGFADPLYELAEEFVGSSDKSIPGVRQFQREVGAWGRNQVDEEFPLSPIRTQLTEKIRSYGHHITGMGTAADWAEFGQHDEFWVDILLKRIDEEDTNLAVPNARLPYEVNKLVNEADFRHFHVMCTPETRKERHEENGESMDEEVPTTERLAVELDKCAEAAPVDTLKPSEFTMCLDLFPAVLDKVCNRNSVVWNDPRRKPHFEDH